MLLALALTINMASLTAEKPHAVCIPYPAQGHINPMLKLAKLLHFKGFHVTFVNTEFNHQRLINSQGPESLKGLLDFQFETIPDRLPPSDCNATQDIPSLCKSIQTNCLAPFQNLIARLNDDSSNIPNVTCMVSDGVMSFTLEAAKEFNIPQFVFFTTSACGLMAYLNYAELVKRGYVPFKDESYFTNGYLDTVINWIPGMKDIQLRDLPSFIRTTDPKATMLNFLIKETRNASKAKGLVLNTFDELEHEVLEAIQLKFKSVYTIGPLHSLGCQIPHEQLNSIEPNLWKEDLTCMEWLNQRESNSVVYVNFGSITVMNSNQLSEFAWGLANSNHAFLWTVQPDLVSGESSTVLPKEFMEETKGRGLLVNWCSQKQVLSHPSVAVFLTHNGWNSTIESITEGVPMICWPFFAEQQTNCKYVCNYWAVGTEIDSDVKRNEVEELVREMMAGEKGKEMKKKALEWKETAGAAIKPGGSSYMNFERLIKEALHMANGFASDVEK